MSRFCAGAECLITSCFDNGPAHRARGFAFDYAADAGGAGSWRVDVFSDPATATTSAHQPCLGTWPVLALTTNFSDLLKHPPATIANLPEVVWRQD